MTMKRLWLLVWCPDPSLATLDAAFVTRIARNDHSAEFRIISRIIIGDLDIDVDDVNKNRPHPGAAGYVHTKLRSWLGSLEATLSDISPTGDRNGPLLPLICAGCR